jgi:hypothetical protein
MTTQSDPGRPPAPSVREIAALTARLRALTTRGREADPGERAAFLADKQALLARIDDSESPTEPPTARADQATAPEPWVKPGEHAPGFSRSYTHPDVARDNQPPGEIDRWAHHSDPWGHHDGDVADRGDDARSRAVQARREPLELVEVAESDNASLACATAAAAVAEAVARARAAGDDDVVGLMIVEDITAACDEDGGF